MTYDPQRRIEDDPAQRRIQDDPAQHNMPAQRGASAHGTATISHEQEMRQRAAPPIEHRPPKNNVPLKIAGIVGLVLLGGLIAGLVASHNAAAPAPVAARTLSSFGAHGSATSPNFTVPSSPVTSSYGYRCPAGTSGRFVANLVGANGADSHNIVNTTAPVVNGSATLHPAHIGSPYHVAVTAPAGCAYRINTAVP